MFGFQRRWPAVFRSLRSSQGHARPPWRARQRPTFRCLPLEKLEERSVPSVVSFQVTSLGDSGNGTLRDAITMADQGLASDSYVINIVTPGPIALESVLPDLSRNITINGLGAGPGGSTVQRDPAASSSFRVFKVESGEAVRISGLTIAGGNAGSGNGGGIDNFGTLTVSNSVFSGNAATNGGGLANHSGGTATVRDSNFTGNSADAGGGGHGDGRRPFTSNSAIVVGRQRNGGTVTVTESTFTGNTAVDGGGLFNGALRPHLHQQGRRRPAAASITDLSGR